MTQKLCIHTLKCAEEESGSPPSWGLGLVLGPWSLVFPLGADFAPPPPQRQHTLVVVISKAEQAGGGGGGEERRKEEERAGGKEEEEGPGLID